MTYKLTYFDIKGRGEDIRLIFHAAGVKFTDVRIGFGDWPALKDSTPWGQLPTLQVGDKILTQSISICRFLATKFGLVGSNSWEAAKCDELLDATSDMFSEWVKFSFESDPEKKAEMKTNFSKTTLPKYLGKINTIKHENGGNWLVGNKMTIADIVIADKFDRLEASLGGDILNRYPHLRKLKENVWKDENLKSYLSERPKSEM